MFIGIAGGSAGGKTILAKMICDHFQQTHNVIRISLDNFYFGLPESGDVSEYNFDHPDAIDFNLMNHVLSELSLGKDVDIPNYDFSTHKRNGTKLIKHAEIIVVEGILVFHDPEIRNFFDLKIFVRASSDIRLIRRIDRDVRERGREYNDITHQYLKYVSPSYNSFIKPTKHFADIILENNKDNDFTGLQIIFSHIKNTL